MVAMKHYLLMIAVVMGQSVLGADKKPLITDPIVEKWIRTQSIKPKGELTKADLGKLPYLYLNHTQITDASLKKVAKMTQLTFLDLGGTKITDAGLKEVAKLQKLKRLGFFPNRTTRRGYEGSGNSARWR